MTNPEETPKRIIGVELSPEQFEHAEEIKKMLGEYAVEQSMDFKLVDSSGDPINPQAEAELQAIDDIADLYVPDTQNSRVESAEDKSQIETETRQAEKDIDFLRKFASFLPSAHDIVSPHESKIRKYREDPDEHLLIKLQATKFTGIADLHDAEQLNSFTIWGAHRPEGKYDTRADINGSNQYRDVPTPSFMVGSRFIDKNAVELLLVSPRHTINIDPILKRDNSEKELEGETESMKPYVHTVQLSRKEFQKLTQEIDGRQNKGLGKEEQSSVAKHGVWPTEETDLLKIKGKIKIFPSPFPVTMHSDENMGKDSIAVKGHTNKRLGARGLVRRGGLEMFDVDSALIKLAAAFDKTEELKTLQKQRLEP